ncbi:MAG: hypothetical protein HYV16_16130 [Gammaproteobacteria bacterium]|nr:hypothetical protein [Gammaproteobacteria bacterium]
MPLSIKPALPLALLAAALAGVGLTSLRPKSDEGAQLEALQLARLGETSRRTQDSVQRYLLGLNQNAEALGSPISDERLGLQAGIGRHLGLSALAYHDRSSNSLHLPNAPSRSAESLGFGELVKASYAQGKSLVFGGEFRGSPALLFAQPLERGGQVVGLLLGARVLDQPLVEDWSATLSLPVSLNLNGQRIETAGSGNELTAPLSLDGGPALTLGLRWQAPSSTSAGDWAIAVTALLLGAAGLGLGLLSLRGQLAREQALAASAAALNNPAQRDAALTALAAATATDPLGQIAGQVHQAFNSVQAETEQAQRRGAELEQELERLKKQLAAASRARDEALRAPRTKSEFLSRMGDEITTPMHSMSSMLELLRQYELPGEPRELINIASRSTHTLVENLNNILDFSKLDAGMLKLRPEHFPVQKLVNEVVAQLKPHAQDKGLRLEFNINEGVPEHVVGDPLRIQQILSNLVGNAVRFTKDGEVAVYVDILQPAETRYLRFSVVDTGVGIPKDAQAGLFDSLDQSSKLTNASFAGRLRLIVARELTALMGGEIGVSSEPGKGSRFWFTVKQDA